MIIFFVKLPWLYIILLKDHLELHPLVNQVLNFTSISQRPFSSTSQPSRPACSYNMEIPCSTTFGWSFRSQIASRMTCKRKYSLKIFFDLSNICLCILCYLKGQMKSRCCEWTSNIWISNGGIVNFTQNLKRPKK